MRKSGGNPAHLWSNSYTRRIFFYVTALLSAVVIISAVASFLVMRNQISKMATEQTLAKLRRTAASFSILFASSIIPAAEQVFESSEVNSLIYGSSLTPQQIFTATQLLDRFQLSNPLIDSIAVYNNQRATVYSTRYGLLAADDARNAVLMRIFRGINQFHLYRFIPRQNDGKRLLTVILGSRPYTGSTLLGGLVINVSENAVRRQLLDRMTGDVSQLTILDSSGTILSGIDATSFGADALDYPDLKRVISESGESGSFTLGPPRSARLVSFYRDALGGWTFVSTTPADALFAGIARWRNETVLVFSILLALSILLSVTTSRRVSLPIDRLMSQARALQADLAELGSSGSHGDNIRLVSETLELLKQRLHDLSSTRTSDERTLARLLLDQTVLDAELVQLRRRLFDASTGEARILALVVDGIESEREPKWHSAVLESCRQLRRTLADLPAVLAAAEVERGTIAVALAVGEGETAFMLPSDIGQTIARAASPPITFTVGVSDPVSDPDELSSAYDSAVEAVRYRFRVGSGTVITQSDRLVRDAPFVLPDPELRRLGEQARLLNESTVAETIRALLQSVIPYSYEDFVFLVQNILHVLERVFVDSGVMDRRDHSQYRSRMMRVNSLETIVDVSDFTMQWFHRFVEAARQRDTSRMTSFVADVRKLIELSLFDPDLSAKSIAVRLRISVNYVRSMYKNATGESISTFIMRQRIERCKKLLESSDMPVKEISAGAGFRNYNYFFTLFKKQTGRTPQEYQRQFPMK